MSNLYDLEALVEQRRRELERAASDAENIRLLHAGDEVTRRGLALPDLRCRLGSMLIRLGSRLAA